MHDPYYGYRFLLLLVILLANAFFAAAEVALLAVRPSRLRQLASEGRSGAQMALSLLANPERLLSVVQVGVTIASLGLGWAGQDTIYQFLVGSFSSLGSLPNQTIIHSISFLVGFVSITFLHVVIGEVVPKNLAYEKADRLALLVAPPLLVFYRFVEPFVFVIERSASVVSRALGVHGRQRGGGHSAEELKLIVSSARREGELLSVEEQVIHRVLDLEGVSVREIMVPRNDVVAVSCEESLEEIVRKMLDHQFTRLPVYEGPPDHFIGILHYKDVMRLHEEVRRHGSMRPLAVRSRLRSLIRKPPVVPETKPVSEMLEEFRRSRVHMALVVDEYGTITGVVTLEDVLEQIFGEIEDEQDFFRRAPHPPAGLLEIEGTTSIRDLQAQYGIELPTDSGFETLAGFILFRLGYIPKSGDSVAYGGHRFTVVEMDRNRIARVRIETLPGSGSRF